MYHAVVDLAIDPNLVSISPERFEAQMRYLKRRNRRGVSIRELRQAPNTRHARRLVGLTFDDGTEDFLYTALPILERFGFTATVFVAAGLLGKENKWEYKYTPRPPMRILSADEWREVSQRGMEVGSHSMYHRKLSGLEQGDLDREIHDSRHILSEVVGEPVEGFAYPYGELDSRAIQSVRRAGYSYACALRTHGEWTEFRLPRVTLSQKDNWFRFVTKLILYPYYAQVKEAWL